MFLRTGNGDSKETKKRSQYKGLCNDVSQEQPPYASASIFGLIFVTWISDLLNKIYHSAFDSERDLWACAEVDRCERNSERLDKLWQEELAEKGKEKAHLFWAFWKFGRSTFILLIFLNFISAFFTFASSSFCVNYLLMYADGEITGIGIGIMLVAAMANAIFIRIIFLALALTKGIFLGARLRNATMTLLYKKTLKIKDFGDGIVGKLINTVSTDGERIQRGIIVSFSVFCSPPLLVAGTIYAAIVVGPLALLASAIFITQFLVVTLLAKRLGSLRAKAAKISDGRLKGIAEILNSMKIIKVYSWENSFMENIFTIRSKERKTLFWLRVMQSLMLMSSAYALAFAQVVAIVALIIVVGTVSPVEAFTLISVLNIMKVSMDMLPNALKGFADVFVAFQRMKEVLLLEEFDPPKQMEDADEKESYCVVFDGATFAHKNINATIEKQTEQKGDKTAKSKLKADSKRAYGSTMDGNQNAKDISVSLLSNGNSNEEFIKIPTLVNMNFGIPKGKLIGICGAIGSGKTSLLTAILGRVQTIAGSFAINGRVAYVPQEAWLNNATVQENITFGSEWNQARYDACIDVCCLQDDLKILSAGDQTEIGERGINLSGGQKQRISLARAVYSDRDLYLLDDPLSAVDNRVGSRIFYECIQETLKNKSVLLVTHQVRFLSRCDQVIFMKSSGMLANHSHEDLMRMDHQYRDMINSVSADQKEGEEEDEETGEKKKETKEVAKDNAGDNGKLTGQESSVQGGMKWSNVTTYLRASGSFLSGFLLIIFVGLNVGAQAFPAWWISLWLENDYHTVDPNCTQVCEVIDIREDPDFMGYLITYGASPMFILLSGVAAAFIIAMITYASSTNFHNTLLTKVCGATMTFFDTTPVGRIQNRFTSDMDQLDSFLSTTLEMLLYYAILVLVVLATVMVSSPLVTASIMPCLFLFGYIWLRTRPAIRDLKRIENVARSPQYSLITSTVQGLTTISAFGRTGVFTKKFCSILDRFHVRLVCFQFVTRWAAIRLDLIVWTIVVSISIVIVAIPTPQTAAASGLALSFALQLSSILFIIVLFTNELIASFTSVERIDDYIQNIPQEPAAINIDHRPDPSWPDCGQILFFDFCLRYQPHLPRVLNNISFRVDPMQKIGVVGRTGAGKSSLMVALFRLIEKESGSIYIDGLDISTIGLRDLRKKLSLIPQDPVLFFGTIRTNVDPFLERTDLEIWDALARCHLKSKISGMPNGLEERVSDGGSNFSLGERQLICMARAVLSQSRILLMDEATASVDPQTDALIQEAIRTSFPECTMLIIAHRLNTVLDCDKILVMEQGQVAEFDTPEKLLSQTDSIFKQLLAASMK